ncbi:MAG: transposase [Candidatus Omnitrophica bacterium]|nr:transposase [Candidatus Omnitrophota bacterium]
MPQIARLVIPDFPHHVMQRGNRNQQTFFDDGDRRYYLSLLKARSAEAGVRIWAYCLMDNHVHCVAVPESTAALAECFGAVHKSYTKAINKRRGWRGFLWQGRFSSYVMDEAYLHAAVRYVEMNPVRAGIVARPEDYPWSSAGARIRRSADAAWTECCLDHEFADWRAFLSKEDPALASVEAHLKHQRPLGGEAFIADLEQKSGLALAAPKRGRPIVECSRL